MFSVTSRPLRITRCLAAASAAEARRDRILRRIEDHRAGLAIELMPKSGQRPVDDGDQPSGPG